MKLLVALFCSVVCVGCGMAIQSEQAGEGATAEMASQADTQFAASVASPSADATIAAAATLAVMSQATPDRILVRNASITLEADSPAQVVADIELAIRQSGGYVSNLQQSTNTLDRQWVTLTIRVPSLSFSEMLDALDSLGRVVDKRIGAEDVTEESIDVDSQTRNLKRTEERLLAHLERTAKLEDIVKVEHELTRVREQIERFEGRLRFLNHRVDYSTIILTIQQTPAAEPLLAETFSFAQIFSQALRALLEFGQVILVRVIWVAVWLPVWMPVVLLALWVARRLSREFSAKSAVAPKAQRSPDNVP